MAALVVAQAITTAAPAQNAAPADEIVVSGIKGQWALEGKRIRAAQAAFAAGRSRYAPGASLFFQVTLKTGRPAEGLALTLRSEGESLPVRLDAGFRFELPPIPSDSWRLTANRTPAEMGIRIWVFSPGSTEADRRVGDLRLHCRVGWALRRDQFSIVQRAAFDTVGGCNTRRIAIYASASRPLASAAIIAPNGTSRPLEIVPPMEFRMPIADKGLPDDARVRLTYR